MLVGCLVDPRVKAALRARANANEGTVSDELRAAIRHHLAKRPEGAVTMDPESEPAQRPEIIPTWRHPDTPLPSADELVPPRATGPMPADAPAGHDLPADE